VSLHDLGLAPIASDLAIDGSVVDTTPLPAERELRGLGFAVLAPPVRRRRSGPVRRLLISLGGGPRVVLARRLAVALHRRWPSLEIVATGMPSTAASASGAVEWIAAPGGLAPWLARVDAAIVGGGLSLYEAVAAGTPAIALAVVPPQRPTIRGFVARGLVLDAGPARPEARAARSVVRAVARLMADDDWRGRVAAAGPRVLDGGGARRVARAIAALAHGGAHA
jgi:spore coat polysaccharide biosynthesis predicted glycosyltransferase SpsG